MFFYLRTRNRVIFQYGQAITIYKSKQYLFFVRNETAIVAPVAEGFSFAPGISVKFNAVSFLTDKKTLEWLQNSKAKK